MHRAYYIDRIRVILTALVIFHHTAITYGGPGGWYYREVPANLSPTGILLLLFVSVNQAYFMGFFFLLAGYFTPASYDRKSVGQFAFDRVIRLGIPLAVFSVLLDPLTSSLASGVLREYSYRVVNGDWHLGPLWFAEALLIFSAGYLAWQKFGGGHKPVKIESPIPPASAWLVSAFLVGGAALLIRQWKPVGASFIGLQAGYFASYIFLFALGTVAFQHNWLERLTWKTARPWTILSIALLPVILIGAAIAKHFSDNPVNFAGGLSWASVLYAFWEPLVAWGIIAGYLVWFRQHGNQPSRVWQYLSARAYAVYILHSPVLVAICVALRPWHSPALAKFAVCGTLACLATLAVSSLLYRVPGVSRVV